MGRSLVPSPWLCGGVLTALPWGIKPKKAFRTICRMGKEFNYFHRTTKGLLYLSKLTKTKSFPLRPACNGRVFLFMRACSYPTVVSLRVKSPVWHPKSCSTTAQNLGLGFLCRPRTRDDSWRISCTIQNERYLTLLVLPTTLVFLTKGVKWKPIGYLSVPFLFQCHSAII